MGKFYSWNSKIPYKIWKSAPVCTRGVKNIKRTRLQEQPTICKLRREINTATFTTTCLQRFTKNPEKKRNKKCPLSQASHYHQTFTTASHYYQYSEVFWVMSVYTSAISNDYIFQFTFEPKKDLTHFSRGVVRVTVCYQQVLNINIICMRWSLLIFSAILILSLSFWSLAHI